MREGSAHLGSVVLGPSLGRQDPLLRGAQKEGESGRCMLGAQEERIL